jgi:hypothetical protein
MSKEHLYATRAWLFAVSAVAIPQSATAAAVAISCALTKEEIFFVPEPSAELTSVEKDIDGTAYFTVTEAAPVTAMESPCDRIAGVTTGAHIDVTCSLNDRASIRIQIDRQLTTISETWDIIEDDGSKFRYYFDGTCTTRPAS